MSKTERDPTSDVGVNAAQALARHGAETRSRLDGLRDVCRDAITQAEGSPTDTSILGTALDSFATWAVAANDNRDDPAKVEIEFRRLQAILEQNSATNCVVCALLAKLLTYSACCGAKTFAANPRERILLLLRRAEGAAGEGGANLAAEVMGIVRAARARITSPESSGGCDTHLSPGDLPDGETSLDRTLN